MMKPIWRHFDLLGGGRLRFDPTPEMVHLRSDSAQLDTFKLVMETQISAVWFDLERLQVQKEMPCWWSNGCSTVWLLHILSRSPFWLHSGVK